MLWPGKESARKVRWVHTQTRGPELWWGRGPGLGSLVLAFPSYLNWLFHTLVKEVERAGPLHPEGKGGPGLGHGETVKDMRLGLGMEGIIKQNCW